MKQKAATIKARETRAKLQALAERGVDGERTSATRKLAKLEARYDFSAVAMSTADIFAGRFDKSSIARKVATLPDPHLANAVKWAIEGATKLPCAFRDSDLYADASERTAARLGDIAGALAASMETLWSQFQRTPGTNPADRPVFIMGLYDGMMNEPTPALLPSRIEKPAKFRTKRQAVNLAPGLKIHPYSVAVGLGRDLRFSVPLEEVTNRLNAAIVAALPQPQETKP